MPRLALGPRAEDAAQEEAARGIEASGASRLHIDEGDV